MSRVDTFQNIYSNYESLCDFDNLISLLIYVSFTDVIQQDAKFCVIFNFTSALHWLQSRWVTGPFKLCYMKEKAAISLFPLRQFMRFI